jgi:hypothetical protein
MAESGVDVQNRPKWFEVKFEPNTRGVNCGTHGIQTVTIGKDWGDEMAELMGKRLVTSECPVPNCASTLSVIELNKDDQTQAP